MELDPEQYYRDADPSLYRKFNEFIGDIPDFRPRETVEALKGSIAWGSSKAKWLAFRDELGSIYELSARGDDIDEHVLRNVQSGDIFPFINSPRIVRTFVTRYPTLSSFLYYTNPGFTRLLVAVEVELDGVVANVYSAKAIGDMFDVARSPSMLETLMKRYPDHKETKRLEEINTKISGKPELSSRYLSAGKYSSIVAVLWGIHNAKKRLRATNGLTDYHGPFPTLIAKAIHEILPPSAYIYRISSTSNSKLLRLLTGVATDNQASDSVYYMEEYAPSCYWRRLIGHKPTARDSFYRAWRFVTNPTPASLGALKLDRFTAYFVLRADMELQMVAQVFGAAGTSHTNDVLDALVANAIANHYEFGLLAEIPSILESLERLGAFDYIVRHGDVRTLLANALRRHDTRLLAYLIETDTLTEEMLDRAAFAQHYTQSSERQELVMLTELAMRVEPPLVGVGELVEAYRRYRAMRDVAVCTYLVRMLS